MTTTDIQEILNFWLKDVGPEGWFIASKETDDAIDQRFSALVGEALAGHLDAWSQNAEGTLALVLLLDQFPRNLYRGRAQAFLGDPLARGYARNAVVSGFDLEIPGPERRFFYLPFTHSENLADQEWSLALTNSRLKSLPEYSKQKTKDNFEMIRRFGRFPARNNVLGRESTIDEIDFLSETGAYA